MENEDTNENSDSNVKKPSRNPKNRFRLDPKEEREKRRRRRARVIVRNISYKATEESLREHFKQFGGISELNLLKRPDGKLVGCAFIQFEEINQAAKAILNATQKEFLGRPVYVDWAIGKDTYEQRKGKKTEDEHEIQTEVKEAEEMEVDAEEESAEKNDVNSENDSDENESSDEEKDSSDDDDDSVKSKPISDDESGDEEDSKINVDEQDEESKPKRVSNDVKEGCTIFIKNVPFDATSDDLRKFCRKFGPVYYALINTERISGHSKGTAFVKFKKKESADKCLAAGQEFTLFGSVMEPLSAISRDEVRNQKNKANQKDYTDSRNLYLVKEGLIMAGSKAAEGVSTADMNKRHKIEQVKAQILKNLNRFVSRNRLSIHNLPFHYDDEKLRKMVTRFTGFKPHECRVMRENKPSPGFPRGKPKGFGFISFKTHDAALTALRKLNNNPKVFSQNSRPIVGFSIEDRSVHKVKERRTEKSRESNPTYKAKLEKIKNKKSQKKSDKKDDKTKVVNDLQKAKKSVETSQTSEAVEEQNFDAFVGTAAKPGVAVRMRSGRKIKEQAQEHLKRVSEQKKKEKKRKEQRLHRIEKKQIDRPKKGKKKVEKDNFSQLVNKYKQMLDTRSEITVPVAAPKRAKWYVE